MLARSTSASRSRTSSDCWYWLTSLSASQASRFACTVTIASFAGTRTTGAFQSVK